MIETESGIKVPKRRAAEVYRQAARLIDKGWTRFSLCEQTGKNKYCYCAVGALNMAASGAPYNYTNTPRVYDLETKAILGRRRNVLGTTLAAFNDSSADAKQVSRVLRNIAYALEHGEKFRG